MARGGHVSIAICPKCQSQLKDDYGMVTCASCEAIVFVDMDGIAHIGTQAPDSEPEAVESVLPEPASFVETPIESAPHLEPGPTETLEIAPQEYSQVPDGLASPFDTSSPIEAVESHSPMPVVEDSPPLEVSADEFSMDAMLGYGQPDATANLPPVNDEAFGQPGDPLGINEFANSDLSLGHDGLLVFHIEISGIDSKEIRESIREAIEDLRFGWDPSELLARINKGHLRLETIPAVKAAILVNRIKRLPVEVRWEQNAITQLQDGDSA
jgi:hypothetical protein